MARERYDAPMKPEERQAATPAGAVQLDATVLRGGTASASQEWVADEVPVAMVYNGISHAVMLASPLDLEDFALGFSLSEGILDHADDLLDCEPVEAEIEGASGITLDLRITLRTFQRLKEHRRTLAGRTGCGVCGAERLADAVRPVKRAVAGLAVDPAAVQRAMAELGTRQGLQQTTGATHAAAWCALDGEVLVLREDVGRHNALDKLVGHLAKAGNDPRTGFVAVTSRASYEMVHKTATAGIGLLAAISAPTALAVRVAEQANLSLVGFARGDRATVYHEARPLET